MDNRTSENNDNQEEIIHSAAGDIHIRQASSKLPLPMQFQYTPGVSYNMGGEAPKEGYGLSTTEKGINENKSPGFFATAGAEFYDFNSTAKLLHAGYEKLGEPGFIEHAFMQDVPKEDFNPTQDAEVFLGINQENLHYLMGATGKKDQQYRRQRILEQQGHDEKLTNGSTFAKIIGGIAGAITDPVSYIPIAGWAKYGKLAPTIFRAAARTLPGISSAALIQAGAKQADAINKNLSDFVIDAGINTAFGTALFGLSAGAGLLAERMELWNLKEMYKSFANGVDFKFNLSEKGEIKGIQAFDTDGSAGAAEVSKAQEIANSSFLKSGVFKLPYIGDGLLYLKGLPGVGSPLVNMATSHYKTMRAFATNAFDSVFITEGINKGIAAPKSFEFQMKKEFAGLRAVSAQMNALHLERMGFDIKPRVAQDLTKVGLGLYNKSLKLMQQDRDKFGWVSRDSFDDEVQQVLIGGEQSQHAAVNSAAAIIRPMLDKTIKSFNEAYGRNQEILSPKMASEYLMRVYDKNYLNVNKLQFVQVIADYFKEADETIATRMQPIKQLEEEVKALTTKHEKFIRKPNLTDQQVKLSSDKIDKKKIDLRVAQEQLQNELRTNEDLKYHVEDWHALSADEANELKGILKPLDKLNKDAEEQKAVVAQLKSQKSKSRQSAIKGKTVETAKKHVSAEESHASKIKAEEDKLNEIQAKIQDEKHDLYMRARNGEINSKFYYPETHELKDPNYRLKFRDVYESHIHRETHAKAAWSSIMHMNPEDLIADVMGKVTGNSKENHLKARSLLVPDKLLYANNFMTKDLMAKVNNYVLYFSLRTHLKNTFKEVTLEGGIEPLVEKLRLEHEANRSSLDKNKDKIKKQLSKLDPEKDGEKIKKLQEKSSKVDKSINKESKKLDSAISYMNKSYERMMGTRKRENLEVVTQGVIRSLTAMANLHFVPLTQVADLGAMALQHGTWEFVRDGIAPFLESIGGLLKTKDSEAVRRACPHVHLGLQDVNNGIADKNISMEAQPYFNLGPWVAGVEKLAHFSGNADLTTYIDNMTQRMSGSIIQSKLME